ncbi:kinase-like domain-containing protein, partial [Phaeosphaeriaceae sp. PMI808]
KEHGQHRQPLSIDYDSLDFLAAGGSGTIYAIDEERVLKEFYDKGIEVERRAFERLGSHPNIVKYVGSVDNSLILERGQPIRKLIKEKGLKISLETKIRWLKEAAEGTRYIHDKHIIHADTGCHNWIIVHGHLKIIDFDGCRIDGEEAGSCYEWFSYKESTPAISRKTDIFAFGCAMYENQYPDVNNLPLSNLMKGCWHGTFSSMHEILQGLEGSSLTLTRINGHGLRNVLSGLMAAVWKFLKLWRNA